MEPGSGEQDTQLVLSTEVYGCQGHFQMAISVPVFDVWLCEHMF